MSKTPFLIIPSGSAVFEKGWYPGNLVDQHGEDAGFLFTLEQIEKIPAFWSRKVEYAFEKFTRKKTVGRRLLSRILNEVDTHIELDGRNIGAMFRCMNSTVPIKLSTSEQYKIRLDIALLALQVTAEAVLRARQTEHLGYVENSNISAQEASALLLSMMGPGSTLLTMYLYGARVDAQNKALLEAYGGQWPEKTRTQATQQQIAHLRRIVTGSLSLENSLDLLCPGWSGVI